MAKDTEKLIRQLSLISYLMAERRPVTALEIRRDVEGYSGMNEDAFARRFYADRAELESLGIQLTVDRPRRRRRRAGELLAAPGELPPPRDRVHRRRARRAADRAVAARRRVRLRRAAAPRAAAALVGPPEPAEPARAAAGRAGHHRAPPAATSCRSAWRRSRPRSSATRRSLFDYYTMERDETGTRKVDPYHLLFQGGQFYLLGRAHERGALRVFRLSRIRGKVAYATKAEHDFRRPTREEFDPREYASRAAWQFGETQGTAEVRVSERIAWQVERHFGRFGEIRPGDDGSVVFATAVRQRPHARVVGAAPRRARRRSSARPSWRTRSPSASRRSPRATPTAAWSWPGRPTRASCPTPTRTPTARAAAARATPRSARSASRGSSRSRPSSSRPAARGELLDAAERPGAPADLRPRAARGHRRPQRRQLRRRHVRALRRGRRRRARRGRPRALRRQLRAPGAAAARRGQGARRRDRPDRRAPARGRADVGAREDRRRARRGPHGARPAGREHGRRRLRDRAGRQRGHRRRPDCCGSTTTSPTRTSSSSGRSSRTRS